MQSIRRTALRSALSASRTVSSTTRSSPFAAQVARKTISPVVRQSPIICARFFSQTSRVANEEKPVEESEVKSAEEAVEAAEQPTQAAEGVEEFAPGERTPYGVFVRNMVYDATEEHLAALCEKFGKVNYVNIARDGGRMSKGFGFVYFTNEHDQQEAIRGLDNSFWHGRRIFLAKQESNQAKRPSPTEPTRSLYVGNLPFETTDAQLNEFFGSLDGVMDVRVAVDRTTGWPRGFCHIDFKDAELSAAALKKLQGQTLGNRQLKVDFASSRDRNLRNRGDRSEQFRRDIASS